MTGDRTPHGRAALSAWLEQRRSRRALDRARAPMTGDPGPRPTERAPRTTRQKALLGALVTAVVLVGLMFVGPFPVRAWWSQRHRTDALQHQIDVVEQANQRLEDRARDLRDPATVARLARRDYGMVDKGEKAYAILPPPKVPVTLPPVWPFVTVTPTR